MKTIALVGPFNTATRTEIEKSLPAGFELLDIPTTADYALLEAADYIIIRTVKLTGADLKRAGRLRLVQKWGAGYDNIDIESISALDIPVAVCAGINAQPVAEMTLLHMLAVLRNLTALNDSLKKNIWAKDVYSTRSYLLQGKKVGLIGLGNIGKRVAGLVRAFGATVQYYDVCRAEEATERALDLTFLPLEVLLGSSDVVSIHVPLTEETRNLLDYQKLCLMKPTAIVVNTARGGIVDEADLARALSEKRILGAGLDAFVNEPPGAGHPLLGLENVVMTPHAGGNTADNTPGMIAHCFGNIQKVENGEAITRRDVVNLAALKTKIKVEE